jgi:hypothetical protein
MEQQRKAFVAVSYSDSGPGLAGAYPGTVQRADVIEVTATSERDACKQAHNRVWKYGTAGGISTRFLRWA